MIINLDHILRSRFQLIEMIFKILPFIMETKIWTRFVQILSYRNDLTELIKPFLENLKDHNINDEKYIPLLLTFSKYQIELLNKIEIISTSKLEFLLSRKLKSSPPLENPVKTKQNSEENLKIQNLKKQIETIIAGDQIKKLQELLLDEDFKQFNTITTSFLDVNEMQIPLIQYCIIKKALECFKYLLVNGYDDPNKTMEEEKPEIIYDNHGSSNKNKKYGWDSMATAIFFGNKEIIKILEDKDIAKGKNPEHVEAAILSYRNSIVEEILDEIKDKKNINEDHLKKATFAFGQNNNIKGGELLINKKVNLNATDMKKRY